LALILPYTLMLVQSASSRILFGMSKHGKFAAVTLIEGLANLILSILLVRPFGILGDALGTAIPLAGTYLFFMPHHLCSRLGIRVTTYLRQAYLLPLMLCVPPAAVLLVMQKLSMAHTYRQLIPQLLAAGSVYAVCLWWAYATDRALHVGDLGDPAPRVSPEIPAMIPTAATDQQDM